MAQQVLPGAEALVTYPICSGWGSKHYAVHPPALHPASPGKSSSVPNFGCLSEAAPARS